MLFNNLVSCFRYYFVFFVLLGFYSQSYSQEKKPVELYNCFVVGLENPFFRTFSIGYQRMINDRDFLVADFSTQSKSKHTSYESKQFVFSIQDFNKNRVFTGRYISLGYGRFVLPKIGFYITVGFQYRYKYFEDCYYYDCAGTSRDSEVSLRSEYCNEYAIRGAAGFRINLANFNRVRIIADFNISPIINISYQRRLLIAERTGTCSSNELFYYPEPQETNVVRVLPTTGFRARIGINF